MEKYVQQEDLSVFGVEVKTFPTGIKEAFGGLMKAFGSTRTYYGISWFNEDGSIKYYAMAAEMVKSEDEPGAYEKLIIEKGEYFTETLHDWLSKTDCIKDIFHGLMGENRPGKSHPCIEWYKSDDEMLCMVKAH